ncbi:indolepyruvate ferredoxin oxidoreductase family protein [Tsuneonella troitsensis]|uniref:indolepyruvate ferredoxin oxidoreductase family protein n=1 Tax=Tsuneonella troitsensis TaxID=292222 RepID=UPI0007100B7F|nr:indolepyruvate ferredoxin oxidoreductase family protein [Tsuneonella troitsensis]
MLQNVTLEDKYELDEGRVFISGTQALTRVLLAQKRADAAAGLNTAGFISGYRGSPLGTLDMAMWRGRKHLKKHDIVFQPGVNEELAATAVYGAQQLAFFEGAKYDGVFSAWYGKGPGVDRAGDALKHGNLAGTSAHGGVLVFAGDDHAAKSSTTAHQSEQALAAALIPVLYPANVEEFLEFGAFGYALSRYSGLWVGFKCVNDTADATMSARLEMAARNFYAPNDVALPPEGLNIIKGESQLGMERRTVQFRLPAAQAYARANHIDKVVFDAPDGGLGIITAGKAYLDVREALAAAGIDERRARKLGVRLLKLGMTWPVAGDTVRAFAAGCREILVIEEKRAFIEPQVKEALYHMPADRRPAVSGKTTPQGGAFLPSHGELSPGAVLPAIAERLEALGLADEEARAGFEAARSRRSDAAPAALTDHTRAPFFCSGCPHNTSTVVPEGSVGLSGIGCHVMAALMPHRKHAWPVQMGGEGANWIGAAPFSETTHVFQNLGDGTYFHSGILAIRAAIAAGVNITYKLLYNDAVAMTGGQPVEGTLTPLQIAHELRAEGVARLVIVADDPGRYSELSAQLGDIPLLGRDRLDAVQKELREINGVTVIIYDQVCAAEKRRRRKRGEFPDPPKRVFINDLVCEGCGDCSVKSNCVSVQPLETEFGRKRKIDQSSCNKDFSCVNGFCPSFVTVEGGQPRARTQTPGGVSIPSLPEPGQAVGASSILITGIGGTGVITVGAVLGMAAHLDGMGCSIVDITGLSQKNGAVLSHLKIAPNVDEVYAARVDTASADLLLACDMITAGGAEAAGMVRPGVTAGVVNSDVTPTAAFTFQRSIDFQESQTARKLQALLSPSRALFLPATEIAERLIGDSIATNMIIVGAACQMGLLPVSRDSIERAVRLNGVAVEQNLLAFNLGRWAVFDPDAVAELVAPETAAQPGPDPLAPANLDELIERRAGFLVGYQSPTYADSYRDFVAKVRDAEQMLAPGSEALSTAVARNLFKLMAYKDEYEVARLYTDGEFARKLKAQFEGDLKLTFHLSPPMVAPRNPDDGLPRKLTFGPWMMTAFRVLARLKPLRGTPFDPFGRTHERRMERRLIQTYRQDLERVLRSLSPATLPQAVELAALPSEIYGYGHIKEGRVAEAERLRAQILARIDQPHLLAAE